MARYKQIKSNFTSGELDPKLIDRWDIKHYVNGAKRMRNVRTIPTGGFTTRWGTDYVLEIPKKADTSLSKGKLIPIEFSITQKFLMIVTELKASIYKDDVLKSTEVLPHDEDDLADVQWMQDLDSVLLFHEDHPTEWIQRQDSDTNWTAVDWPYDNIPEYQYSDTSDAGVDEVQIFRRVNMPAGGTFRFILGDEDSEPITIDASQATTTTNIQTALRNMPNTSASGITVSNPATDKWEITFGGDDGGQPWGEMDWETIDMDPNADANIKVKTHGEWPGEDAWSASRGYPSCGGHFQGRLWVAGAKGRPNAAWGSRSSELEDFNTRRDLDAFAIELSALDRSVPSFHDIHVGPHLLFLASSGIYYIPKSDEEVLTPTNSTLRRTSSQGAKKGIKAVELDDQTIYIGANDDGVGIGLRELNWNESRQKYDTADLSIIASHLISDPVAMCVRKKESSTDANYIFIVNDDGTMTIFNGLREQEVNAFTLASTDGTFLDVCSLGSTVYVIVERTINSVTKRYLEKLTATHTLDCAISGTVGGGPISTITGLDHLNGETVDVYVDGRYIGQKTVSSNQVSLAAGEEASSTWLVGLPWPDVSPSYVDDTLRWYVETLPIRDQMSSRDPEASGVMLADHKRVVDVKTRLYESVALICEGDKAEFVTITGGLDSPVDPFTGLKEFNGQQGWDPDKTIWLGADRPGLVTVTGIYFKADV